MSDGEDDFRVLAGELKSAFRSWRGGPWDEGRFRKLALRSFRLQYESVAAYRAYCDRRGRAPRKVSDWREVPPVPTAAFRSVPLIVGDDPGQADLEFRTSGTSRGGGDRGSHWIRDAALYRASLEPAFRRFVLPEAGEDDRVRIVSLLPPFPESRHSSLCWMADALLRRFGDAGSGSVARGPGALARDGTVPGGAVNWQEARGRVRDAAEEGAPVVVLATTLAVAEWMGRLAEDDVRISLPPGSRLMDTGGAKGRTGLERPRVLEAVRERLGLGGRAVVNELGMTELLSQRYAPSAGPDAGWLAGPPWLRTRALDPVTLDELPEGEVGLLCHHDLANAGSVSTVLTEDLGRVRNGRVQHCGRTAGSPPRGCSLATAELLEAAGGDGP